MKKIAVLLSLVVLSFGYGAKKEMKPVAGPLHSIQTYHVIPLWFFDDAAEEEGMRTHVAEILNKLGTVHLSTGDISDIPSDEACLMMTLDDSEASKSGKIKIFAESEVIANKYKTSSEIWRTYFVDPTLPYPVDTEDGIIFTRDVEAQSPDMATVAAQMMEQFSKQYQQDNPRVRPIFYLHNMCL